MSIIYGTDGNAYATSINNGKEYTTSLKNEKEEFAIAELEYLKANIRFQGYYNERIEDLIDTQISVLKGKDKSEQADTEFNHEAFYEFLLNVINPNEMEKYRSMFLSSGEIVKGE